MSKNGLRSGSLVTFRPNGKKYEFEGTTVTGKLIAGLIGDSTFYRWRPQRDSNPCLSLERATSWASGRWGRSEAC